MTLNPNFIENITARRLVIVLTIMPYTIGAVFCGAVHFVKVLWRAAAFHWARRPS